MSTVEREKTAGYASPDDEDWLYGDNNDDVDDDDAGDDDDDKKTETEIFSALVGDVEGVNGADNQDVDSDSDDNLHVTISSIKTDKIQSISTPVHLKTSSITTVSGTKIRGVTLVALDSNTGTPGLEVDEELEEKPWRKPGADLSDYFNYGFNEDTWKSYCDKHRKLRMSSEFMTLGLSDKNEGSHDVLLSKSDCSSRKLKSTIDVIGGQKETIICVEGRRNHSTDGSITQVQSSFEQPVHAEPPSSKLPPFFPPIIPPPPFPLLSISSTPPFIQQPLRPSMSVPPPGFPLPPEVPSPPFTSSSSRSGGSFDGRCAPLYPFPAATESIHHVTGTTLNARERDIGNMIEKEEKEKGSIVTGAQGTIRATQILTQLLMYVWPQRQQVQESTSCALMMILGKLGAIECTGSR
ncbi:hypothetical protein QTP86_031895 [Hemibagrus guttatus]|nr:hypothetical protein QTP86_031895 [Hemibagrus guttatus]